MSKKPPVVYAYDGTGLTGESAYLWALFLAHEADMADDYAAYDKWRHLVDSLKPRSDVPVPASFYCGDLMDAIEGYNKND